MQPVGRGRGELIEFDGSAGGDRCFSVDERSCTELYRLVIPGQSLTVRLNGLDPDASPDGYLPAVRPYGTLRMAWAIWREVPDVAPKRALSLARWACRKGEAEVLLTSGFLAGHVQRRLRAAHHLVSRLEPVR